MKLLRLSFALAAATLLAGAANAGIVTVSPTDIGHQYTMSYDGYADGSVIPGLGGQTVLTLTSASGTSYTFDYSVTNTSTAPIDTSRISIFGFNTDPNISNATSTGTFSQTATNANVPTGFGNVDVCFKDAGGQNSCSGGGGTGLQIGDTGTGTLTLNFTSVVDQLTLSDFFVRYQSISGGGAPSSAIGRGTGSTSTGSSGSTGSTGSTGGTPVPAPDALWLFALALGGLGWHAGRKPRRPAHA
jgi:hypothetical protein